MYQLYYYPGNASQAVHMLLVALDVDFQLVLVDRASEQQKSAEYLKLNPAGRIPTLVVKHLNLEQPVVVFECTAICLYLLDQHPDSKLIPAVADHVNRSQFYQWFMYINNTLQAELMLYIYPEKHTTEAIAVEGVKQMAQERIIDILVLLDKQLKDRMFMVGSRLSVVDFLLFMVANWATTLKKPPLSFPHLGKYLQKLAKDPVIKTVFSAEGRALTKYL